MIVSKEVELTYPIEVEDKNGNKIDCKILKLQRLKLKHLKILPEDFVEKGGQIEPVKLIPLIAGLANISEDQAGEIDFKDIEKIAEVINSFLADIPVETGKSSSGD